MPVKHPGNILIVGAANQRVRNPQFGNPTIGQPGRSGAGAIKASCLTQSDEPFDRGQWPTKRIQTLDQISQHRRASDQRSFNNIDA